MNVTVLAFVAALSVALVASRAAPMAGAQTGMPATAGITDVVVERLGNGPSSTAPGITFITGTLAP